MSPKEPGCMHRSFFTDASAKDNTLHIIQMSQNSTNLNETKTNAHPVFSFSQKVFQIIQRERKRDSAR